MSRRKAPYVKQALASHAIKLAAAGKSINSRSLVASLYADNMAEIEKDMDDVISVGLMVLAGRLTTAKDTTLERANSSDHKALPLLIPLRSIGNGATTRTELVLSRNATPRQYLNQAKPAERTSVRKPSAVQQLAEEMAEKGELDTSFGEYLAR